MITLASLVAALLYVLPVVAIALLRARRGDRSGDVALSIPFGVALDALLVMTLSRIVHLETAVLVSRVAWIAASAVLWQKGRLRWPSAIGRREIAIACAGAAVGLALSLLLSRPYAIWDRHWHTPLTSSLRAQTIPFSNVYDPREPLTYHFAGNVVAAAVQTLSFGVVHASLALSLTHDVLFALTGATIALLVRDAGVKSRTAAALAAGAVLTAGPIAVLRRGLHHPTGYAFVNFLSLSFRPHVSLGGLLFVGAIGTMLVRLTRPAQAPPARTGVVLVTIAALLAVTDETSLGMLGVALGAAWLVRPDALATRRWRGLGLLASLPILLVAANRFYAAALSPGAPARALRIVGWRLPGFYRSALPLASAKARELLAYDLLGLALVAIGGVLLVRALSARRMGATVAAFLAMLAVATLALTRLDINGQPIESHRFVTAALLCAPMLAVFWIVRSNRAGPLAGPLGRLVLGAAAALGSFSTLAWLWKVAPLEAERRHGFFLGDDFYATNCREATGATLGADARPRYLAKRVSYLVAGCRALFVPGTPPDASWGMRINAPEFGARAVAELDRRWLGANEPLLVDCPAHGGDVDEADDVCAYAMEHGACAPMGAEVIECALSSEQRHAFLSVRTIRPPHAP